MAIPKNEVSVVADGAPSELLTTKEAAALLRLSPATLEKWRVRGAGPRYLRLGNKAIRYRLADLNAVLREGGRHD